MKIQKGKSLYDAHLVRPLAKGLSLTIPYETPRGLFPKIAMFTSDRNRELEKTGRHVTTLTANQI